MPTVLTVNSGSSSVKASLFAADGTRRNFHYTHPASPEEALDRLLRDLDGETPDVVGHRFVHGGDIVDAARLADAAELQRLEALIPLAPLHLPGNLTGLHACLARFRVPQVVCFDTAFHQTMPELAKRLPIPSELGMRRYGFHGLNYAYIASVLAEWLGEDAAQGRVIVAHLGSGASLCMLHERCSVDTTMGYTPAGGIPMATRSGDLDPGVMLELMRRYDHNVLTQMVFYRMGLSALSAGETAAMDQLLQSSTEAAQFAVEYFCCQVRAAIGGMAAKWGGVDALVFTAGIGEHAPEVRRRICQPLGFLGFELDELANQKNESRLNRAGSKPVLRIEADEERMIYALAMPFAG